MPTRAKVTMLLVLITTGLVVFRLTGLIDWNIIWILSPMWGGLVVRVLWSIVKIIFGME